MSYLPRGLRAAASVVLFLLSVNAVAGQTPPATTPAPRPAAPAGQTPAAPTAPPAAPRPRPPAPRSTMVFLHVRNADGRPLSGVHVIVSGAATRDMTTDFEGIVRLQSMADGAYHVRFDRDGFVSLEQDLTLKAGQPEVVNVVLNEAPPPAPPPPAPAAPAPEPPPPTPPPSAPTVPPPTESEQKVLSIPDFLSKNFIGRDNLKESTLGCTGTATTRLVQIKTMIETHAHADVDEALYVVAGEGTLLLSERIPVQIGPGSLGIVPRGVRHSVERKGKNPLILLSTQSGTPCTADAPSK